MNDEDPPQLKMMKITLANLDWEDDGENWNGSSFLSLPDPGTLNQREREDLEWVVARDRRKFANMPMVNERFEFKVAPLFAALLQSPRLARLWAEMGDLFITSQIRGTLSELERAWIDMGLNPLLVNGWVQSGNIPTAAAHGISVDDIVAIRNNDLDALAPDARRLVDLAQATAKGCFTQEQFRALVEAKGTKWAVEAIGFVVFRIGSAVIDSVLWAVQGIHGGSHIVEEMIAAYRDGTLGSQSMMNKEAFANERA